MKRSDIITTHDDYLNAIRRGQVLLTAENAEQVRLDLLDRTTANRQWAALYDLQILMQLAKRANLTVPELTEWLHDATEIRKGFAQKTSNQKKLFKG